MVAAEHVIWIVTETFGEHEGRHTYNVCWRPTEAEAIAIRNALIKEHLAFARGLTKWTNKNPRPRYIPDNNIEWDRLLKIHRAAEAKVAMALNKSMMRPVDISRLNFSYFDESLFGVESIGENPGHPEDESKRIELTLSTRVSDNQ